MSRTNKREKGSTNPVKRVISYKPNSGVFVIYNKETKEKNEVKKFSMIILDADRFSISGFSPEFNGGFVSNLVFNTKKEQLTVGVVGGGKYKEVVKGFYQDIKGDLEGANYTKNVIGLVKFKDGWELCDLQLVGTARQTFSEWFNENESQSDEGIVTFSPSKDVYNYNKSKGELEVVPTKDQKRWRTTWLYQLELSVKGSSEEEEEEAIKQESVLLSYFKSLDGESGSTAPETKEDVQEEEEESDDLPF